MFTDDLAVYANTEDYGPTEGVGKKRKLNVDERLIKK